MALKKKGRYWYGTGPQDVQAEMVRFSQLNGYPSTRFSASVCSCGNATFKLESDEDAGAARRSCAACGSVHLMGDSAQYADEAEFERHDCACSEQVFQLLSGVALYDGTNDVRWYYIGCLCVACQLVGVFADWKCEAGNADVFLAAT
ncbi:hypothetical protein OV208_20435 [Corallococcus sp. bb12-1]|uniref:hypothetical protein n=1 Tax=Corallococcus sp. bb12-1 TaxID=2996784 RepID=UPI00226E7B08|nr:hypothetical protein [Corallococcus sp. bb12-1]MCY1043699.1 hypothetical protein [Corallococcus sp. bb12-1]